MNDIHAQGIGYTNLNSATFHASFKPNATLGACDAVYWYFTDTQVVGQTIGNAPYEHSFPGAGTYSVCMYVVRTAGNGEQCDGAACRDVKYLAQWAGSISVSPNPTHGQFRVGINPDWTSPLQFRMYDVNGRLVASWQELEPAGKEFVSVDLGSVAGGLYVLEVVGEGGRWVKKVVVE